MSSDILPILNITTWALNADNLLITRKLLQVKQQTILEILELVLDIELGVLWFSIEPRYYEWQILVKKQSLPMDYSNIDYLSTSSLYNQF